MIQHKFNFKVYFEREGSEEDNTDIYEVKDETGVGAWVALINHFGFEFNTGRTIRVDCIVDGKNHLNEGT